VTRSTPDAIGWYLKAGEFYLGEGQKKDALSCFQRIADADPGSALGRKLFDEIAAYALGVESTVAR
jgi:hypothetical protein